jgi:hypothetical protein
VYLCMNACSYVPMHVCICMYLCMDLSCKSMLGGLLFCDRLVIISAQLITVSGL